MNECIRSDQPLQGFSRAALVALLTTVFSSASWGGVTFEEAAGRYCDLYNPESWSGLGSDPGFRETFEFITREALKIENDEMAKVVKTTQEQNLPSFHSAITRKVEERLGKEWNCSHIDDFFYPKQTVIPVSFQAAEKRHIDPNSPEVIVVMFAASGDVLVDGNALKDTSSSAIEEALHVVSGSKPLSDFEIALYFDEGADGGRMAEVLNTLGRLGVRSLYLVSGDELESS